MYRGIVDQKFKSVGSGPKKIVTGKMKVPYHYTLVCGDIVFAARGGDVHSFNLNGSHLSVWRHPIRISKGVSNPQSGSNAPSPAREGSGPTVGPPSKRRRVETADDTQSKNGEDEQNEGDDADNAPGSKKDTGSNQRRKRNKIHKRDAPGFGMAERPFVQGLTATTDSKYIVAVTDSDKTIWVFEHDGKGNLKELSQR